MRPNQNDRVFVALHPISMTNLEAVTSSTLDVSKYGGARYLTADLIAGTAPTSFYVTAWTCQESDDNTTFATIAAASGGSATATTVGFAIPAFVSTADNKAAARMCMPLANRKRYIKWVHTANTTVVLGTVVHLSYLDEGADTDAERGVGEFAVLT